MHRKFLVLFVFVFSLSVFVHPAYADVAPPEAVPGSNLLPGEEETQVRMMAETVTLTISEDPQDTNGAVAETRAVFTMRNLGAVEEKMDVRFPLSFFNGNSDGFGNFPEIGYIAVKVDGKAVSTHSEVQSFVNNDQSFQERDELPWAVFEVTFPPGQDVLIEVSYQVDGYGYYPYQAFKYVLETGAGWNGTIGSAEIILRLPYEANEHNVDFSGFSGFGETTQSAAFKGNEVQWKFQDLEPTYESNMQFVIVAPALWNKVLTENENVAKNPNDGEAWGRLAKNYKDIIRLKHGELRNDPAGMEMFELSRSAYEKCLALLPDDPLWQYGYADLLWPHYYYDYYFYGKPDTENLLPTVLMKLKTALELDPDLQQAKELLDWIYNSVPGAVYKDEFGNYDFAGLTATPVPPTPWRVQATPTFTPAMTAPPPTFTTGVIPPATPEPTATNPLCGTAALLPALAGLVYVKRRRL